MPVKMFYQPSIYEPEVVVDVYHFQIIPSSEECIVTGWCEANRCWITAPVYMFSPANSKKVLKE